MTSLCVSWNQDLKGLSDKLQLQPETKEALHGLNPQGAWLHVRDQVAGAVEAHNQESEQILDQEYLNLSPEGLRAILEQTNPEDGLNLLLSVRPHIDLSKTLQTNPLTVLHGTAEIFTLSDELAASALRRQ